MWCRLLNAYAGFQNLSSPIQSFPNLNRYSAEQLEAFLETCDVHDFQKEELRRSDDRLSYYQEIDYWFKLSKASGVFQEFCTYLHYNKIFLSRDLFELFTKIESALIETEVELEDPEPKPGKERLAINKKLNEVVGRLLEQVENAVQKRLHFDQA